MRRTRWPDRACNPISDNRQPATDNCTRRRWLQLAAAGLGGSWLGQVAAHAAATAQRPPRACILLWMNGGPSQHHTFSPPAEGREYGVIPTAVPGIQLCDTLPLTAKQAKHLVILRGMSTPEKEHERARSLMHDGYRPVPGESYPALGAVAARELGLPGAELPNFVLIETERQGNDGPGFYRPVASHLGSQYGPLVIEDPDRGVQDLRSPQPKEDFAADVELLRLGNRRFQERYPLAGVRAHVSAQERAVALMHSPQARAFRLDEEPAALRQSYGTGKLGKACLMARRLVEAGVPFVEVVSHGWDMHGGAAKEIRSRCQELDPALATLLGDLHDRGLLASTLVVWMGEFGRTPGKGTGHYSEAWTTVLAGGGLKTGQVVGKVDAKGAKVTDRPVGAADFMATVCKALAIDGAREYHTADNRPIRIVDRAGKPVEELF